MNRFLSYIIISLCLTVPAFTSSAFAQKKAKNVAKTAVKKEDMSQWTENPVCKVMIIDSLVVEKNSILSHLRLPAHMGRLYMDDERHEVTYENEFADQRMFAVSDTSGHHNIYRQVLLGQKWGEPELLSINGSFLDIRNPFPMPDGQTLFFSATSEDDNEGKCYSLYTTTYDSETNSYLTPQRLPYPYTSTNDDLWYIEDEVDSLAWFVSSRRQPEGHACIYTIRIHEPWLYYDSEETDPYLLKRLALIDRIADTWPSAKARNTAYAEVTALFDDSSVAKPKDSDATFFVVDDTKTITDIADFSSEESRSLYSELSGVRMRISSLQRQLEEYRKMYHNSSYENRSRLAGVIRDSEKQLITSRENERNLSNRIRKIEQRPDIEY